eukprot:scaffold54883_cov31-Tisochrysis_lutea.AAC.2
MTVGPQQHLIVLAQEQPRHTGAGYAWPPGVLDNLGKRRCMSDATVHLPQVPAKGPTPAN